tara:strand:- start:8279 stop:8812 length:534 start_codon:yes stop_codon:yes gene_type:complete
MPTGHIMMAMTLDGFVARKDHALDWLMKLDTEGEDHGFTEFQGSIDVIVMGTGSYKTILGFDEWVYQKPVVVLSKSLTDSDVPGHLKEKVEISQLSPDELMAEFKKRGYDRVYVDGGAVIRSFLRAGHIADMKVTIVPVLIGEGIRMFGELDKDIDLELLDVTPFKSGLVDMRYKVS